MAKVLATHNGRDVTEVAISCNLGSGLMESMRIAPIVAKEGDVLDVIVRMRVGGTKYEPIHKEDFDGPYRLVLYNKALAVTPTTNATVGTLLDKHIGAVRQARELPGQTSIDDAINGNGGTVTSIAPKQRKASRARHPSNGDGKKPRKAAAKKDEA